MNSKLNTKSPTQQLNKTTADLKSSAKMLLKLPKGMLNLQTLNSVLPNSQT